MKHLLTTLCVTLLIILLNQQSQAQCHIDDWNALKALYGSTDGDNWRHNNGWEEITGEIPTISCDLNLLYGISLDSIGRVSCIDLDGHDNCMISLTLGNKLSGRIPSELGRLTNLKWLNLKSNRLSGNIPPELGNLSNLVSLNLRSNMLNGSIPPELGNLSNLENLELHINELNGSIPPELGNLNNLIKMRLVTNQLSGSIPPELGNLSNLTNLELFGNQLTGGIPSELSNLSHLIELDLFGNQLSGGIPSELGNLNNLRVLWLSDNQISGTIPPELGNLSNLTMIRLGNNQLSGKIPSELGKLSNLKELILSDNQLSGSLTAELGCLSNLSALHLWNNKIDGKIPPELGNLSNLTSISMSSNQLSGSIPKELGNLERLTSLSLASNQLSGYIPPELGNLSSFTSINFFNNKLIGSIPPELGNLYSVNLNKNQLSGKIPPELGNQSKLRYFHLEYNYFSCQDVINIYNLNQQIQHFGYLHQYYTPLNYESIKSNIFDTLSTERNLSLQIEFPFDTANVTYQWFRNGEAILGEAQAKLNLDTIKPENSGKYELHVYNDNCLQDNNIFEAISDPIYVIVKGYDLYGQTVEYDQIMVQFDNEEETKRYENEILTPNAGWVKDACNCNRELYLWQFPSTEAAIAALLEIDEKTKRIKSKNRPKGGFNNNLSIGESTNTPIAYNVISNSFNDNYPDSVSIFILDSGLNEQNFNAKPFLYEEARVDSCYGIEKSPGYSYVDSSATISQNYSDELWHGTFGFRSITKDLQDKAKLKLIPLKIFDENGKGNLFDMACALYHAIDHNANIINISAGYQGQPSTILESAINLAREKGVFITAAAGNDTLNIDNTPQYPAYYAGQYYKFEIIDASGNVQLDSIKYDNVISVASINAQDSLSLFSNYGKQSVTLATYGENIHSYGIEGLDVVASGSSMATYFATKALALEIAENNKRAYQEIWNDFEAKWLKTNSSLINKTQTGKQINFETEKAIIEGCTDTGSLNYFMFANVDDGSCITGIEDNSYEVDLKIYPNPSNGIVYISFDQTLGLHKEIEVFDSSGKLKFSSSLFNDNKLNLNGYISGIYFIKISSDKRSITQRLVIK